MQQSIRHNYLQTEVMTATPQKLQLLLIEAAIKNIHRTKQSWKDQRYDDGFETLSRAQEIITEILCSLDREGNPAIAKQLASIYVFIFRRLAEGGMTHDEEKLDDALRVLNSERETWRLVCEKFGSSVAQTSSSDGAGQTAKPDLSSGSAAPSSAKILVPQKPTNAGSGAFSRPLFGNGVKPLGASGIQTDSSLAGAKPSKTADNPPKPAVSPSATGNSWDA